MKKTKVAGQEDTRELPARAKGRERRRQIIEAAKRRLLSAGIEGLVLRDIAEDLGITHGNLQYYFGTKASLLEAIFDEEIVKYTDTMKIALGATSSQEGRLAAFLDSSVDLLSYEEVRLWHVLFGIAHQNPELAAILRRENERYEQTLADELGRLFPDMPLERRVHVARMIRMLIDGLGITVIYERPDSPEMLAMKGELKAMLNAMLRVG
jgi:AcrR family transcriptional regulator